MKSFASAALTSALLLALVAGPVWAGDAWVAEYAINDHKGERTLVLVRGEDQVEYRLGDESPRIWRRMQDGVEMRELHRAEQRTIVYSPGDLRTLGMEPEWARLAGIVDPGLLTKLSEKSEGAERFGQPSVRYAGNDEQGNPAVLDWLLDAALPLLYCAGERCLTDIDTASSLRLRGLKRMPAEQAFSSEYGLLETDQSDLGDMEMNPEIRRLTHAIPAAQATQDAP